MKSKFYNRRNRSSYRLRGWDYGNNAIYFITICIHKKECLFGYIKNQKMHLSTIGKIVQTEWLKTFDIRTDMNLKMDEYVIMPNHFHAIIIIGENKFNNHKDARHCVPTIRYKNQLGPQSKNLASVIRGFKMSVTKHARKINPHFAWQTRFHDHIIRNRYAFDCIRNYIQNNPINWHNDGFSPQRK